LLLLKARWSCAPFAFGHSRVSQSFGAATEILRKGAPSDCKNRSVPGLRSANITADGAPGAPSMPNTQPFSANRWRPDNITVVLTVGGDAAHRLVAHPDAQVSGQSFGPHADPSLAFQPLRARWRVRRGLRRA
jgi:hypothetical protein